MIKKDILDILVDQKIINQSQKEQALIESQKQAKPVEQILLEQGLIKDTDLAQAYATKFEYVFIDSISEPMADTTLLAQIPLKFLRENTIIPLKQDDGSTIIVTANPFDYQPLDELSLQLNTHEKGVATPTTIINAINRYYPLEGTKEMIEELAEEQALVPSLDFGTIEEEDILGMASEAPIIKLVNHILYQAVKREASDIHVEPFEKELRIRYRIDGILYTTMTPPKRVQAAVISRIKIMAHLNIAEKRQPQDGRIQIKIADKAIDIRVSVLPTAFGEKIVMRLLDKTKTFGALKNLGFSDRDYGTIMHVIAQPNGIFLITGPTGSGKTSTLYSILNELNSSEVNIVTVEDPVEYQMMGINQVQVNDKISLTFAAVLRSILRQDPDIIMIGETRDPETAQIAIQAALTGHLVLSTLHTNSAAATITRLLDMGLEPFLLASTILAIMAQRLVRKLCMSCRKTYIPDAEILKRLGISPQETKKHTFYEAHGCDVCLQTGYKGRLAIFEIMTMSPTLARLTIDRADTYVIQKQAEKEGMTLLIQDGVRKILAGLTTIQEVLSVATTHEGTYE
ncbi:MAG: type II secretion system ATPase GspE [Candidatus Babeliaceae bacterium]